MEVGTIQVSCDIDALDARGDTAENYLKASIVKEALLDDNVPTRSTSTYFIDKNGKPILGYFGDSDSEENAHSVPAGFFSSFSDYTLTYNSSCL